MVYVERSYCIRYLVTHPQVVERLGLSFSSSEELIQIIDKKLPSRLPQFIWEEVIIAGQKYEFYHRDIIQCFCSLYSNPELAPFLVHAPEKQYTTPAMDTRMYSEMHTGKWWWKLQVCQIICYEIHF